MGAISYRLVNIQMDPAIYSGSFSIPVTLNPIVNTPLFYVGQDESGKERYWTSTYNSSVGTTGVLLDKSGNYKLYHFSQDYPGFYSICAESSSVLWLCGTMDKIVRLDLNTGFWQAFDTGAEKRLVFQGMAFDGSTGKLLVADQVFILVFDTVRRTTVKIVKDFNTDSYMRYCFKSGDGIWNIVMESPDASLISGIQFLII